MSNHTYLFYDIETTGLNKCFDQILQFAAIRTDHQLNELERHEIQVKLNSDVIPSPFAVITHRIPISDYQKGISEYEAIQQIHRLVNTPNTISVGYNSLGFDDEFLRFSFYKNLLSPYSHQFAHHCGRMDMYPIALLYYLFKRDIANWPDNNLKLENINHVNQLFKGQSHNAMVDVEITLALARKFIKEKTVWDFATQYFNKNTDEKRITDQIGLMVNGKIGNGANYIAPVIALGQHQHYKNQQLWLRLDNPELANTTEKTLSTTTRIFKKKLGEPPIFLPLKERYLHLLSSERKQHFENNLSWLKNHDALFRAIAAFYQHEKYPDVPECDPDAALYKMDFSTPQEEKLFQTFHETKPESKMTVAKQFPNTIRRTQAIRIMGRHFPMHLTDNELASFNQYITSVPVDFKNEPKRTKSTVLLEIESIIQNEKYDDVQKKLLHEFKETLLI